MSLRLRLKNSSTLAKQKISKEIEGMRERLRAGTGDLYALLDKLYVSAASILGKIGEPSFKPALLPFDADPDPVAWNRNMDQIESDLRTMYSEIDEIKKLRSEAQNAAMLAAKELQERANYAQTLITDLRLIAGQLDQELVVAGDDFANMDRVDTNFPLTYPMADINTLQGIVTLKRLSSVNVMTPKVKIQVTPIAPTEALNRLPTPDNSARFYEGHFYASIGEARPEGGKWHLEERVRPGVVVPGASDVFNLNLDAGQADPFKDFPDLATEKATRPQGFPLNPEDIVVIDRGANLEELNAVRARMVDGDPDSFYECEFVIQAPQLDAISQQLSGIDKAASGSGQTLGDELPQVALVSPEELRARAAQSDIDRFDFEVEIVFELESRQTVNFITINPMNFGETAWLEVVDVSTASNEDDAFHLIEGFGDQSFDNILTNEANEELTEGELKTTLAPNRYTYRGLGVYTFPPRQAQRIRIRLRQRTPVPVPYERTVVQLNRTLSSSTTSYKGETCFAAGTLISTPGGQLLIEQVRVGDTVTTFSPETGLPQDTKVVKVAAHKAHDTTEITLFNNHKILTTPNHYFFTLRGWVRAKHLQPSDKLIKQDKENVRLVSVKSRATKKNADMDVYNIYTQETTFLADGILVSCYSTLRAFRTWLKKLFSVK
jgi:hypothetical protein